MAREANAPDAERDAVGLAVDDAHAPVIDAERVGADLRHHRLEALPDRGPPVTTSTAPEVSTVIRTPSDGPSPLFSTKIASPAPTHSPRGAAPLQILLQLVPADRGQRLVEQAGIVAGIEHDFGAERRRADAR